MLLRISTFLGFAITVVPLCAQGPDLVGYWHNWNDASAPYVELDQVDPRYTVVEVAFAEPIAGTTYDMQFTPSQVTQTTFIAQLAALQAQAKKVLISIGGANAAVQLNSDMERDQFVSSLLNIIATYGFDGIDIDLEGSSISISGGTIAAPIDQPIIRLIDAINTIADQFQSIHGVPMMLTMAPETAYVQGGQSAFGGIWGAYLPILDSLRSRIDILQVQLYNSGSMYGIDGGVYAQGSADFIISQTEALLQGFATAGGYFAPLPPEKVAIGLPACPNAAGGGYVSPAVLAAAVDYLRGTGTQPGSYVRTSTYPTLRGLMTWSINWDAVNTCGPSYEYAQSFEDLFIVGTSVDQEPGTISVSIWPSPVEAGALVHMTSTAAITSIALADMTGRVTALPVDPDGRSFRIPEWLAAGSYVARLRTLDAAAQCTRVIVLRP